MFLVLECYSIDSQDAFSLMVKKKSVRVTGPDAFLV